MSCTCEQRQSMASHLVTSELVCCACVCTFLNQSHSMHSVLTILFNPCLQHLCGNWYVQNFILRHHLNRCVKQSIRYQCARCQRYRKDRFHSGCERSRWICIGTNHIVVLGINSKAQRIDPHILQTYGQCVGTFALHNFAVIQQVGFDFQ